MIQQKINSAIVVGGGLAGLSAAYRLVKAGWKVKLFESNAYPGGRATNIEKQGYIIDTGATGVGDCYTEYLSLVEALGISDKVVVSSQITGTLREGRVYELNGKYPHISGLFSRLLSWRSKLIMQRMFVDLKKMGNKMNFQDVSIGYEYDNESAEDYALARLNQELLDYFVDPILRALVVARAKYVSKLELMNAINGLFSTQLVATRGGMGLLPRTLAQQIDISYNVEVQSIEHGGDNIAVEYHDANGIAHREIADTCVIATLLPQAVSLYPECLPMVQPMAEALHYIPGVCVHLGYSKLTSSKALMILVSSKEIPEITLFWLDHNKAQDRAPEGHSLIYLYYDDTVANEAAAKTDELLVQECHEQVVKIFPELKDTLDMSHVSRWDAAVPMPAPGMYKRMYQVRKNLDENRASRVQLAGDYLSCVGQNTAIVYGNKAADNLIQQFGSH